MYLLSVSQWTHPFFSSVQYIHVPMGVESRMVQQAVIIIIIISSHKNINYTKHNNNTINTPNDV